MTRQIRRTGCLAGAAVPLSPPLPAISRFAMKMFLGLVLLLARMGAAEVHYGLIGVAATDTARLSAFCSEEAPADPCDLDLHFHDIRGQIVKRSALNLQPGFTGSLDVRPSELGVAG